MSIEQDLKELIVDRLFLDIEADEIQTDTELVEYGVDSFLLLEAIVAIEEQFDIRIEQKDIKADTLKSIASLTALVRSKK